MFLQSERFDRVGDHGRRGVVSLLSIATAWHGEIDRWSAASGRLHASGRLSAEDAGKLVLLDAFGAAIAKRAMDKGVKSVVFDRGGFRYHGRVASLAEGAREAGLEF